MQDPASAIVWVIPVAILVAFGFAYWLARDVLGRDTGSEEMQDVGAVIYEGAVAFIRRQYTTVMTLAVVTAGNLIATVAAGG
ncbi:MAG: sodium/proton-translocating pyrophosphatase, partial [Anaerolineae bacterium]